MIAPGAILVFLFWLIMAWLFRREIAGWLLARFDDLVFGEGWVSGNGPAHNSTGREPSPKSSFIEALKPIGGPPSWESVRRER